MSTPDGKWEAIHEHRLPIAMFHLHRNIILMLRPRHDEGSDTGKIDEGDRRDWIDVAEERRDREKGKHI